jgi:hypothetical protein
MYKLVRLETPYIPDWIEDSGHFNTMPKPYVPSTLDEFNRLFLNYPVEYMDYRQAEIDGKRCSIKLVYFYDVAFALIEHYWEKRIDVYKVGCNHDWDCTVSRMCYAEYVCKKCGCGKVVDSSD